MDEQKYKVILDIACDVSNGRLELHRDDIYFVGEYNHHNEKFLSNLSKVKYKILQENGPAGNWPEVEFEGTKENLLPIFEMVKSHNNDITDAIKNWDGSQGALVEILF